MVSRVRGDDDFDTNLPFVTERGSNAQGTYTKWSDGFVVQVLNFTQHAATNTNSQAVTANYAVPLSSVTNAYFSIASPDSTALNYHADGHLVTPIGLSSIVNVVQKAQVGGSFFMRTTVEGYE
ncbi:hypothetical protein NVP1232O_21 [Vibrio phage 1.232.O._10N.261.51.E11]|nr:hypothetical protein NVP1232O_21 [Vibrio phage 1.232.O._10N.261.51.E11]